MLHFTVTIKARGITQSRFGIQENQRTIGQCQRSHHSGICFTSIICANSGSPPQCSAIINKVRSGINRIAAARCAHSHHVVFLSRSVIFSFSPLSMLSPYQLSSLCEPCPQPNKEHVSVWPSAGFFRLIHPHLNLQTFFFRYQSPHNNVEAVLLSYFYRFIHIRILLPFTIRQERRGIPKRKSHFFSENLCFLIKKLYLQ